MAVACSRRAAVGCDFPSSCPLAIVSGRGGVREVTVVVCVGIRAVAGLAKENMHITAVISQMCSGDATGMG
ncbi:hypothetical protein CYMTET_6813 [Cymbomonas tetramitiformis]|uniref:Uncharacterized protein n=1 Tax=Cymbomonas tetramitiformis TaxID=36881 RepID=A0AAE0GWG4_9CHLO|nr:hypothetical protein CYMTET_6813 [Cymbomonas tetramitiformis]